MRKLFLLRRGLLVIGLAIALLMVLLPRLLSSQWVYSRWVDQFRLANYQLQIQQVSLRWFGPLQFDGITIRQLDTNDDELPTVNRNDLIQIQSIHSTSGLLGLLLAGDDLGNWTIDRPTLDVELLEEGNNLQNLVQAVRTTLQANRDPAEPETKLGRQFTVIINDASVAVNKQGNASPLVIVPPFDTSLTYSGNQAEPQLDIQPTQWLDHVQLTPQLMSLGLQLALPSLANATWIDGEVSLATDQVTIPIQTPLTSRTEATLTLHNVRAGLQSPALRSVAQTMGRMIGVENEGEVRVIDNNLVTIKLHDGIVEHEGFRFGLPQVDTELQVSTSGQVHLIDHKLDANLKLPIPLKLLARKTEVRDLGIPLVNLPIRGTLEQPQIDWTSMRGDTTNVLAEIGSALGDDAPVRSTVIDLMQGLSAGSGDETIAAAAAIVGDLRSRLKQRRDQAEANKQEAPTAAPETPEKPDTNPRRPLRDRLRRRSQPQAQPQP